MVDDRIRRILDRFDFCKEGDVHAVTASSRFRRDLKKQLRNNESLKDNFESDRELFYSGVIWKRKSLDTKQVGIITYSRTKEKKKLWQTRTNKCGKGKGRIWFVFLDDEPDAPRPVILLLGCELTQKRDSHNKQRIKELCGKGIVELLKIPVLAEPDELPDKGRVEEFEDDPDIRPMYHGNFQAMMELFGSEVGIRLTKEQYETILRPEAPIFINGQAGTGKTVLLAIRNAIRFLVACEKKEEWRSLTTCMSRKVIERLENNTKDVLSKVFKNKKAEKEFRTSILPESRAKWMRADTSRSSIFKSFSTLQYEMIDPVRQKLFDDPREDRRPRRISFSRFSREFYSRRQYPMSSELAWFGIRSLIKGYAGRNEGNWLRPSDLHRHVSDRTMEIFSETDLKALNDCFSQYQNWLESKKLYDDMDLARDCWKRLTTTELKIDQFDEIYLDEAQDLTDLEFRILLKLLKPERVKYAILAGDPLQTINPTGFDWPRIKEMMFQTLTRHSDDQISIPEPMTLTKNYRTPIEMVQMGNTLLERRAHYQKEFIPKQSSTSTTDRPIVLQINEEGDNPKENDIAAISHFLGQPSDKRFILTYTVDNADIDSFIGKDLASRNAGDSSQVRIESITDVKGLERDTVVLYRFAEKIGDSLRFLTKEHSRSALSGSDRMTVLFSLNKLYISVTRSKRNMFILDTKEGIKRFWKSELFDSDKNTLLDYSSIHETSSVLRGDPRLNEDIDSIEYGKQCIDRFRETEDPKFLAWAINALEDVKESDQGTEWNFLDSEARALFHEHKANSTENHDERIEYVISAASEWKRFGNRNREHRLLRDAELWEAALQVDCSEGKRVKHLIRAITGARLTKKDYEKLIGWVKKEEELDWLPEKQALGIHTRVVRRTLSETNLRKFPEGMTQIIDKMTNWKSRSLWTNELIEYYRKRDKYKALKKILNHLILRRNKSETLRRGIRWCLQRELEPLLKKRPTQERIKLRQDLADNSDSEQKRDITIEIALDHIELFLKEITLAGKLVWSSSATNRNASRQLDNYRITTARLQNLEFSPTGRIHSFITNDGLKSAESIIHLVSLVDEKANGLDLMRKPIRKAITTPEFEKHCLLRATSKRTYPLPELLDSKDAIEHLIMAYDKLNSEEELLYRFKDSLIAGTEIDGNRGGRRELRERIFEIWADKCKTSIKERETFIDVCVRLIDFKRIVDLGKKLNDEQIVMRASAEEIISKVNSPIEDLISARDLFIDLGLDNKAQQAQDLIPKDPEDETQKLITLENGILGLSDALELLTTEVSMGRLSSRKAIDILNRRRKVEGIEKIFASISASPFKDKVYQFAKSVQGVQIPSFKDDPIMNDWFSPSIRNTLFKLIDVEIIPAHFESIWDRTEENINNLVLSENVGQYYTPLQRRFWSNLESFGVKEKIASLAWFSLFEWLEKTKPTKIELVKFMTNLNLEFKKSEKVGDLRHKLITQIRPEHEKQTGEELKGAISRLCD